MSTITIQSVPLSPFAFSPTPSAVYLRVYLLNSFVSSAGIPLQASAPDDKAWYKQVTCSLSAGVLTIPSFTLDSTTNGLDRTNSHYACYFYDQNGRRLAPYDSYTPFRLSHLTTPVSWADIRAFNFQRVPVVDNTSYTKLETEALIANHGGIPSVNNLTGAITIAAGASGTDFAVAAAGSTVTLNLPDAGVSSRGLLTAGTQTIAGNKSLTGITKFGGSSLVTETAWGNFDGSILMAGGADSSLASPSSSVVPSLAYQTHRNTGTNLNPVIAYGFEAQQHGGYGDLYGTYCFTVFDANMSGYPVTDYNKHAGRDFLVMTPTNIPASANLHGYGRWIQAERRISGLDIFAIQADPNNKGADAEHSDTSILNKTGSIATNAGEGDYLNSFIIFSQARRAASFSKAWKFNPETFYRHGIDFKDAYVTLVGILKATNGNATVTAATFNVSGATNASPIVITTSTAHSQYDGAPVTVASVGGNTAANGSYFAKVTGYSSTTFALYSDYGLTTPVVGNAVYTSGGTVTSGTKFLKQIVIGDALQINGVYSVVQAVASDLSFTLTSGFTGSNYTGNVTKYPVPIRLATNSSITSHSDNSNVDYRAFYLAPNDVWNFDPDARGTIFGGNIGFGVTSASNPLHLNSGASVAVRIDGAGNQQTTIGAAGGASALPATPLGYLKVSINNFTVAVPYYLPS